MADEQITQTTETQNSEAETTSESQATDSSTSTTDQEQTDRVDLSQVMDGEQTAETKTEGEETTEETTEEEQSAENAELFGAPAEGEDYVLEGLPEGTVIDEEALAAIVPVAREMNLSSKGLSKIAGVYAEKVLPGVATQVVNGINADVVAKRAEWEGEAKDAIAGKLQLKNDAGEVLAFDGQSMKQVQATAAKALDKFAPEGFRTWLDETGLSVHPNMIAFAYQAGKLIAEDNELDPPETGKAPSARSGRPMTDESKFYSRS